MWLEGRFCPVVVGRSGFDGSGIGRVPDGLVWLVVENCFQERINPSQVKIVGVDFVNEICQISTEVFAPARGTGKRDAGRI